MSEKEKTEKRLRPNPKKQTPKNQKSPIAKRKVSLQESLSGSRT